MEGRVTRGYRRQGETEEGIKGGMAGGNEEGRKEEKQAGRRELEKGKKEN